MLSTVARLGHEAVEALVVSKTNSEIGSALARFAEGVDCHIGSYFGDGTSLASVKPLIDTRPREVVQVLESLHDNGIDPVWRRGVDLKLPVVWDLNALNVSGVYKQVAHHNGLERGVLTAVSGRSFLGGVGIVGRRPWTDPLDVAIASQVSFQAMVRVQELRPKLASTTKGLSPRALDVLRAMCHGKRSIEIAHLSGLQPKTVKQYLALCYAYFGVTSPQALVVAALKDGFEPGTVEEVHARLREGKRVFGAVGGHRPPQPRQGVGMKRNLGDGCLDLWGVDGSGSFMGRVEVFSEFGLTLVASLDQGAWCWTVVSHGSSCGKTRGAPEVVSGFSSVREEAFRAAEAKALELIVRGGWSLDEFEKARVNTFANWSAKLS